MNIDATELTQWANTISASSNLPALVRRLILATSEASVSMRAGEGTRLAGFDGLVDSQEPHNYIPPGQSVWEMGVNVDVRGKADDDYNTRTAKPLTVKPADTTFVFVTPRRWSQKGNWVQEKKKEGKWKDVRVIDADDLEGWLSQAPSVDAWLAPFLGKPATGLLSAETYWANWANVTNPPLIPEIVLAGWNDNPAEKVCGFLAASPNAISISAESKEVAAVYVAATLVSGGDELERDRNRTVFIEDEATWSALVRQEKPLLLVPLFERQDRVTAAVQQGHHIVVPLGHRAKRTTIKLNRQFRRDLRDAFNTLAIPDDQKDSLATLARRTLLGLRRKLAHVAAVHRPAWATPEQAQALIAPALAGSWAAEQPGDQEAISRLAGRPYADVERDVIRLASEDDPPLRRTGGVWTVTSKEDAWGLVAPLLASVDVQRFEEVVLEVLGSVDPRLELPEEQYAIASFLGKEPPRSGFLREDLADSLVLMVARQADVDWNLSQSPQEVADRIVRKLLSSKDLDVWRTMSWVLPKLAEASPEAFLDAVEKALDSGEPSLPELFQEWKALGFGPSPAYPGLLWALERLAWSSTYLQRVSFLLGRLWFPTSGKNLADGPLHKLTEIFRLWIRNTSAPLEKKIAVIDALRGQLPEVAWLLMQSLIPSGHDHSSPTSQPDWRDWGQWESRSVPYAELYHGVDLLIDRLLTDAEGHSHRAIALMPHLNSMTTTQFTTFLSLLKKGFPSADIQHQRKLMDELREFIGRHREFSETDWATKGERLDKLEALLPLLEPEDLIEKYRWLFKPEPWIGIKEPYENRDVYYKTLSSRRVEALTEISSTEGINGILRLLGSVPEHHEAYWLGSALAQVPVFTTPTHDQWKVLLNAGETGRSCLSGLIHSWLSHENRSIVEARLTSSDVSLWTSEERAFLLLNLPPDEQTWRLAEGQGEEVSQSYWERINCYALSSNTPEEKRHALNQFLKVGRFAAAFDLVRLQKLDLTSEEWKNLLYGLITLGSEALQNRAYDLRKVLDKLSERHDLESLEVAKLAWLLLPLFRFEKIPKALTNEVLKNSQIFAEMVALAFPKPEIRQALTQQEQAEQQRAFELLYHLRGIPGMQADGTIDGPFLMDWVRTAREILKASDDLGIGDDRIGTLLATAQTSVDGQWPPPEVCDVIEEVKSEALEAGFQVGKFNLRGVTSRALDSGGEQERELAKWYEDRAVALEARWPRTSAILRGLAQGYWNDAKREDESAALTQDRWR